MKLSLRTILWTFVFLGVAAVSTIQFYTPGTGESDVIDPSTYVIRDDNTARVVPTNTGETEVNWRTLQQLDYQSGRRSETIDSIDGQEVRIAGFMVPLEDEQYSVTEFLLVPYPQACIHVPAPPPNQIVHVVMEDGKRADVAYYSPIWAYGKLTVERKENVYTEAFYVMEGHRTTPVEDHTYMDY